MTADPRAAPHEVTPLHRVEGQALSWELRGDVLEVTLHRAPCNEIGTTTLAELERLAALVRRGAHGARALIWTSRMRGFCAGADLRELHAGLAARRQRSRLGRLAGLAGALGPRGRRVAARATTPMIRREIRAFLDRIHLVFDTFDAAPLTTIAAVHGVCFGGGFELALTADIRVAEKSARFAFPELRLGLVPGFGGIPRLERDVGQAVVRDLLLTGRSIPARRAHEVGLVSQVVPTGRALEVARGVAGQALRFDPATTAAAKAFAKAVPRARLEQEKETFCRLVTRPQVFDALQRFVDSDDLRPYLP